MASGPDFLHVLPFLDINSLKSIIGVNKRWNGVVSSNDLIWHEQCKRAGFNVGDFIMPSHSWFKVFKQMFQHNIEMKKEKEEYKKRYERWREKQSEVACGMRMPPRPPQFRTISFSPSSSSQIGGFKVHPDSKSEKVIPFSLNLIDYAKTYLDLLIEASKHDEFHNDDFLYKAIKRYVNFLQLKHKYKKHLLIPTLEIEYVWVSHMLRPSMYIKDCTALFGEVINHDILVNSSYEWVNRGKALEETKELYEKEFGLKYLDDKSVASFQTYPIHNVTGHGLLHPGPTIVDDGDYFRVPNRNVLITSGPAFCPFLGNVEELKVNSSEENNKKISLRVSDLRMDEMWLGEFDTYMKKTISQPLEPEDIYGETGTYGMPCHMQPKEVYRYIWKAYERFLYMAAKYPPGSGQYVHPSYAIDVIWHSHMINPKVYAKEVQEWVGYLVDHEPWPECKKKEMDDSVAATQDLWKKEFGISMDQEHRVRPMDKRNQREIDDYDDMTETGEDEDTYF